MTGCGTFFGILSASSSLWFYYTDLISVGNILDGDDDDVILLQLIPDYKKWYAI